MFAHLIAYYLLLFTNLVAVGYTERMKLSDYAKQMGVRYETAWRWYRDGKIQGRRVGPRTIIITEGQEAPGARAPQRVALYPRVSSLRTRATWTDRRTGPLPTARRRVIR